MHEDELVTRRSVTDVRAIFTILAKQAQMKSVDRSSSEPKVENDSLLTPSLTANDAQDWSQSKE